MQTQPLKRQFQDFQQQMQRVGILVVDTQVPCTKYQQKEWGAPTRADKNAIESINALLKYARRSGINTVLVEHIDRYSSTGLVKPGLPICESIIKSAGSSAKIFVKEGVQDAFEHEGLAAYFEKYGPKHLVVCGMHRDICVYQTAKSAVEKGHAVIASEELFITRGDLPSSQASAFYQTKTLLLAFSRLFSYIDALLYGKVFPAA